MDQTPGNAVDSITIPTWYKVKIGVDKTFDFHSDFINSGYATVEEFIDNLLQIQADEDPTINIERWEQLSYNEVSLILSGSKVKVIDNPGLIYLGIWNEYQNNYMNFCDPKFMPIYFRNLAFVEPGLEN